MGIQFDQKSFILHGTRTFLNCAAIHYFRMPRAEWREVLVKAKLAGCNCIDTYFAWNVHEAREGVWDFNGDRDAGAFLDLCAELGLYVVARPGPFICAEWDFGGFPWWLATKGNMKYRTNNPQFMDYTLKYFDQIIPIIAKRQLGVGGTVILVQVENEYSYLSNDEHASDYMLQLKHAILDREINVPLITCEGGAEGTIEGANFWTGANDHYEKLNKKQPDVPKLVTEFWTGWFEHWGGPAAKHKTPTLYERHMYEVLAAGFDGMSHYMFFGGTNFGSYGGRTVGASDIFMVTSYDYDAPLNEYGRTTDKYMIAKKMGQFVQVTQTMLLESERIDQTGEDELIVSSGLKAQGRQWHKQKLWFIESTHQEASIYYCILSNGRTLSLTIKPNQIVPVFDRFEISSGLNMTTGALIIGNEQYADRQLIIASGDYGQRNEVIFESDQPIMLSKDHSLQLFELSEDQRTLRLDIVYFREPQVVKFTINERIIELVIVDERMTECAWRIEQQSIKWLIGFEDVTLSSDGQLEVIKIQDECQAIIIDAEGWEEVPRNSEVSSLAHTYIPPELKNWTVQELDSMYTAHSELHNDPLSFKEVGLGYGYLLYSTDMTSDSDQETTLVLSAIQDSARVYVNDEEQAFISEVGSAAIKLKLKQGVNTIQFLVQEMGRLNFSPYLGEEKGLSGHVYKDGCRLDIRNVQVERDQSLPIHYSYSFQLQGEYNGGLLVGDLSHGLKINGSEIILEHYQNWFQFYSLDISSYLQEGMNVIEMPIQRLPIKRLELLLYNEAKRLQGWESEPIAERPHVGADHWKSITMSSNKDRSNKYPQWLKCEFETPARDHRNVKLKLRLTGMSKGFLLLNGHQLGRYWQIGPQEDYKIPISWLREEGNELILFDEEGRSASQVKLLFDNQSRHHWFTL